jgi:hypothetical protein
MDKEQMTTGQISGPMKRHIMPPLESYERELAAIVPLAESQAHVGPKLVALKLAYKDADHAMRNRSPSARSLRPRKDDGQRCGCASTPTFEQRLRAKAFHFPSELTERDIEQLEHFNHGKPWWWPFKIEPMSASL